MQETLSALDPSSIQGRKERLPGLAPAAGEGWHRILPVLDSVSRMGRQEELPALAPSYSDGLHKGLSDLAAVSWKMR